MPIEVLAQGEWKTCGADLDPIHNLEPRSAESNVDQLNSSQSMDVWIQTKYQLFHCSEFGEEGLLCSIIVVIGN